MLLHPTHLLPGFGSHPLSVERVLRRTLHLCPRSVPTSSPGEVARSWPDTLESPS